MAGEKIPCILSKLAQQPNLLLRELQIAQPQHMFCISMWVPAPAHLPQAKPTIIIMPNSKQHCSSPSENLGLVNNAQYQAPRQMVTLITDIKAEEKTAEKEATIRKYFVAREKIFMFSLQQKSESVNSRLKKLGEDLKTTANHKQISNEIKTPSLPSADLLLFRSKPHTEKADRNLGKTYISFPSHTPQYKSCGAFQEGNGGTYILQSHLADKGNIFRMSKLERGREGGGDGRRAGGRDGGREMFAFVKNGLKRSSCHSFSITWSTYI